VLEILKYTELAYRFSVIRVIQKQLLLPIGAVFFIVGIGLTFYNVTSEEWHIGEGTDHLDDRTWVIKDQMLGLATPWSYDLGNLPEGTRIYSAFNEDAVTGHGMARHIITEVGTGDVLQSFDMNSYTVLPRPLFTTPRTGHYKYTVQAIMGYFPEEPVEFDACIQAYKLVLVYPHRLFGVPLLIAGVALAAYSKIKS
jgi:hypothetical protein